MCGCSEYEGFFLFLPLTLKVSAAPALWDWITGELLHVSISSDNDADVGRDEKRRDSKPHLDWNWIDTSPPSLTVTVNHCVCLPSILYLGFPHFPPSPSLSLQWKYNYTFFIKVSNFLRGGRDYSCPLITKWNRAMIYGAIRGTGWN